MADNVLLTVWKASAFKLKKFPVNYHKRALDGKGDKQTELATLVVSRKQFS